MATNNNNKKGDFPETLAGVWKRNNTLFPFASMPIDARTFDQLTKVLSKLEVGGKLRIKAIKDKSKETAPDAYIEYMTPAQVAEDDRRFQEYKSKRSSKNDDDVI